jgi:acetoin utilization deacetylase AcuC-like enzyme
MRIFYTDSFVLPLPPGHRFPMQKYARLRACVEAGGLVPSDHLVVPRAATDHELYHVHAPAYVRAVSAGALDAAAMRRIGFPWSPAMVERSRRSVGATISAASYALQDGYAVNLAGGTHHSFPDRGEGFCVFNDVAVAIRTLQAQKQITRAVVIDLDVHQGNGTAFIFRGDPNVFTFSVHGANNFPFHKEPADLDYALPDRTTDDAFLTAVSDGLELALRSNPDLAFFIAGADPYEGDRLGRLSVSRAGLAERDHLVYAACERAGVPVVTVMGGGYAHNVEDTVAIHFHAVRAAALRAGPPTSSSL